MEVLKFDEETARLLVLHGAADEYTQPEKCPLPRHEWDEDIPPEFRVIDSSTAKIKEFEGRADLETQIETSADFDQQVQAAMTKHNLNDEDATCLVISRKELELRILHSKSLSSASSSSSSIISNCDESGC